MRAPWFFLTAVTQVTSSGSEVPNATRVAAITLEGTESLMADSVAVVINPSEDRTTSPIAHPSFRITNAVEDGLLSSSDLLVGDENENWNRVNFHLDTVEELELIGPHVSKTRLLNRLFHEEKPRIFQSQSVKFGCTCSPEKVKNTMSMYSSKDIEKMTTPAGKVTADCQFCGAHYIMDPATLGFDAKKYV